jgi:hypothetical protein
MTPQREALVSNKRHDDETMSSLDDEVLSPELLAMHRRLEVDGASWRRHLPSTDPLLQRVLRSGLQPRPTSVFDEWRDDDPGAAPSSMERELPPRKRGRIQGIVATSAAIAVVVLFALLVHALTTGALGPSATGIPPTPGPVGTPKLSPDPNAATGEWRALDGLTLTSTSGRTSAIAIAPSDPRTAYEALRAPAELRRTRDSGASWQTLETPVGSVSNVEIYISPLDANHVFLTLTVTGASSDTSPCPSAVASAGMHGGILASGGNPCSTTYHSTDGGAHWKMLRFPVPGAISGENSDFLAVNPLQAQGSALYALLNSGPFTSGGGRSIVKSTDGGTTWRSADPNQGKVCTFAATPNHDALFAATTTGTCGVNESGVSASALWRSDDGGNHWRALARPPNSGLLGMAATYVAGADKPTLYIESPRVQTGDHTVNPNINAAAFYASTDDGAHWIQAPRNTGMPSQVGTLPLQIIARADGSIVLAFLEGDQQVSMTLYMWKPGQRAWHQVGSPLRTPAQLLLSTGGGYWAVTTINNPDSTDSMVVYQISA